MRGMDNVCSSWLPLFLNSNFTLVMYHSCRFFSSEPKVIIDINCCFPCDSHVIPTASNCFPCDSQPSNSLACSVIYICQLSLSRMIRTASVSSGRSGLAMVAHPVCKSTPQLEKQNTDEDDFVQSKGFAVGSRGCVGFAAAWIKRMCQGSHSELLSFSTCCLALSQMFRWGLPLHVIALICILC